LITWVRLSPWRLAFASPSALNNHYDSGPDSNPIRLKR
jgi:hypothetical protein